MPFVRDLLRYTNKYFLETGTYQGDTTQLVADSGLFEKIYTVEFSEILHRDAVSRFAQTPAVHCFHASSRTDLWTLIQDIRDPITFWLDAHWSSAGNVGVDSEVICPVLEELEQIKKHPIKNHTIIVDDMRRMDGKHFPVTIQQILQKIREINPNYIFRGYTDSETVGDVLVAFVGPEPPQIAVHKYLTKCQNNPQPPGFGDVMRGIIAMYYHSRKYNYRLILDTSSHPLLKYLQPCDHTLEYKLNDNVHEFIPGPHMPRGFDQIDEELEGRFKSGELFCCVTDAFYKESQDPEVVKDCKEFMKRFLTPSDALKHTIIEEYKILGVDLTRPYIAIHFRFGDVCLENSQVYSPDVVKFYSERLTAILEGNPSAQFVLLTDSEAMGKMLKEKNSRIMYSNSKKLHTGSLSATLEGLERAAIDMFIIIKSQLILSNSRSGFSWNPAYVFDIPYYPVF